MQQQPKPLPPILCLIDGYPGSVFEGREASGMTDGMKQRLAILDRNPGRWALVHSVVYGNGGEVHAGTKPQFWRKLGYEVETINCDTYARRPHPNGRPLSDFVTRQERKEPLPKLRPAQFGWSRDEINSALATAKTWLFPIEGIQAA